MTFIEIKKQDFVNPIVLIGVLFLTASFVSFIFIYKNLISVRHDVERNEEMAKREMVKNADLKSELYRIMDEASVNSLLVKNGLILDKGPHYVVTSSEISYNE